MQALDFPYGMIAIVLGILFTIAKLDTQGRKASDFEHVPTADFERWQNWTNSIYRLGAAVCFFRVIFTQVWAYYVSRQELTSPIAPPSLRYPALAMDVLWLGVVAATFIRARRARELRYKLGILLSPMTPQQQAAAAADQDEAAKDEAG
ncbi:MAG TPA: hypothetical protein VJN18_17250 [Polyangiaceae bacterium]|nr:hypothetical protein [Polyangiaceae bacterium]